MDLRHLAPPRNTVEGSTAWEDTYTQKAVLDYLRSITHRDGQPQTFQVRGLTDEEKNELAKIGSNLTNADSLPAQVTAILRQCKGRKLDEWMLVNQRTGTNGAFWAVLPADVAIQWLNRQEETPVERSRREAQEAYRRSMSQ